ncbi:MAG: hypothetical protein KDC45_05920 [Bacteroidetes bacterium]|nr:hypothetical protein [Bacteroidota bacterium]
MRQTKHHKLSLSTLAITYLVLIGLVPHFHHHHKTVLDPLQLEPTQQIHDQSCDAHESDFNVFEHCFICKILVDNSNHLKESPSLTVKSPALSGKIAQTTIETLAGDHTLVLGRSPPAL